MHGTSPATRDDQKLILSTARRATVPDVTCLYLPSMIGPIGVCTEVDEEGVWYVFDMM